MSRSLDEEGVRPLPSQETFEAVFERASVGMAVVGPDGTFLEVNPALARFLGYSVDELKEMRFRAVTHPDDLARDEAMFARLSAGEVGTYEIEKRYLRADGGAIWAHLRVVAVGDASGDVSNVIAYVQDITLRRKSEERARQHQYFRERLLELVETSLQTSLDEDFYGRVLETATSAIPGAQGGSVLLRGSDDRFRFAAAEAYDLDMLRQAYLLESELYRDAGVPGPQLVRGFDRAHLGDTRAESIWGAGDTDAIRVSLSIPVDVEGRTAGYLNLDNFEDPDAFSEESIGMARIFASLIANLLTRFHLEEEMRRLAFHDPLTGLPNRGLLNDRIEQTMHQAARTRRPLALALIDLDDFKDVNDRLGHDAGDALLVEVAERLRSLVRTADTAARWGGDEFVLLLPDLASASEAESVAERVVRVLREPYSLAGRTVHTTASLGFSTYPSAAGSLQDLFRQADAALYRAKELGRDRYVAHGGER